MPRILMDPGPARQCMLVGRPPGVVSFSSMKLEAQGKGTASGLNLNLISLPEASSWRLNMTTEPSPGGVGLLRRKARKKGGK